MGDRGQYSWSWQLSWRRALRSWELDLEADLLASIAGIALFREGEDRLVWIHNSSGEYSVKSCCSILSSAQPGADSVLASLVWRSLASPKVEAFLRLLVLGKVHTRDFLLHIGLIDENGSLCPFCQQQRETPSHLFLHCSHSSALWYKIMHSWGCIWVMPINFNDWFQQWDLFSFGKLQKKVWFLIFSSAVWTIWLARNNLVFNDVKPDWEYLFSLLFHRVSFWAKAVVPNFIYTGNDLFRTSDGIRLWSNS